MAFQKDCLDTTDMSILHEIAHSETSETETVKKIEEWIKDPSLSKLINTWDDDYKVRSSKALANIMKQSEDCDATINKQPVNFERLKEMVDDYHKTGTVKKKSSSSTNKRKNDDEKNLPEKKKRNNGEGEVEIEFEDGDNKKKDKKQTANKSLTSTFLVDDDEEDDDSVDSGNKKKKRIVVTTPLTMQQFCDELLLSHNDGDHADDKMSFIKLVVAIKQNINPTELFLILKSMKDLHTLWFKEYIMRAHFEAELLEKLQQIILLKAVVFNRIPVDPPQNEGDAAYSGNMKAAMSLYSCILKLLYNKPAKKNADTQKILELLKEDVDYFKSISNSNESCDGKVQISGEFWCKREVLDDCLNILLTVASQLKGNTATEDVSSQQQEQQQVLLDSSHFQLLCYRHCASIPGGVFISSERYENLFEENLVGLVLQAIPGENPPIEFFDMNSLAHLFKSCTELGTPAIIFDGTVCKLLQFEDAQIEATMFKKTFAKLIKKIIGLIPRLSLDQASLERISRKEAEEERSNVSTLSFCQSPMMIMTAEDSFATTPNSSRDQVPSLASCPSTTSTATSVTEIAKLKLLELKDILSKATSSENFDVHLIEINKNFEKMIEDLMNPKK